MASEVVGGAFLDEVIGVIGRTLRLGFGKKRRSAILLAAGESSRMGKPKALLPWGEGPLIAYQIRQLRLAGLERIVVVLGCDSDEIRPHVPPDARVVVNTKHSEGRASSLRAGANDLPGNADPIVVLDVDRPRRAELLRHLLEAHTGHQALISRPVVEGRGGHPLVLSGLLLGELRAVDDASQGLLAVVNAHRREMLSEEVGDPSALVDFNTPEEYEAALSEFGPA